MQTSSGTATVRTVTCVPQSDLHCHRRPATCSTACFWHRTFTFLRYAHGDWCTILSHDRPAPIIPAARLPFPVWNKRDPQVAGQRMQKRRLLDLRREGYREVAKPLEPCECVHAVLCVQCMGANRARAVRASPCDRCNLTSAPLLEPHH